MFYVNKGGLMKNILIVLFVFSICSYSIGQTVLRVPSQYLTIQSAIDAAINSDTVIVSPGIYKENINFNGKAITIASFYKNTRDTSYISRTVIDGNNSGITVKFYNYEKLNSVLQGFTIINGWCGIKTDNAAPTLKNLIIKNNNFGYFNATAIDVFSYANGPITIDGCIIEHNEAAGKYAVYILLNSDIDQGCKISNTIIRNNTNGISLDGSPALIDNCIVANNTQVGMNISYYWNFLSETQVRNSTFCNNGSYQIQVAHTFVNFKNLIIWSENNTIAQDMNLSQPSVIKIGNSIVKGGRNGVQLQPTTLLTYESNNINSDPLLQSNLKLTDYSPAIGSGNILFASNKDFENNPRPNPSNSNPDIGAYENQLAHFKLYQPVLITVSNDSKNLATTQSFKWRAVYGATKYHLQISTDSLFSSSTVNDSTLTDTTKSIGSLANGTKYYWRVRGTYVNDPYDKNAWSNIWDFTTIVAAPDKPTLVYPNKGSNNVSILLSLKWNKSSRTEKYHLTIASDSLFTSNVITDTTLIDTSKIFSNLINKTKYYWKVRAKNVGGISDWSDIWNFTTIVSLPSKPRLVSPITNQINSARDLTFRWNKINDVDKYVFQLSKESSFSTLVKNDTTTSDTTKMITGLLDGQKYYWRVGAMNLSGFGPLSDIWNLTTMILAPSNLTLQRSALKEITLQWNDNSNNGDGFIIERKSNQQSSYALIDSVRGRTNLYIDKKVDQGLTYYYRIKLYTNYAQSNYSNEANLFLVGVETDSNIPTVYSLNQNYPNPFNPTTKIKYGLPETAFTKVTIYDVLGKEVKTLVHSEMAAGYHEVEFNASNLSSGIYFYRIQANKFTDIKKMLLIK